MRSFFMTLATLSLVLSASALSTEDASPLHSLEKRAFCTSAKQCYSKVPVAQHAHAVCKKNRCTTACDTGYKNNGRGKCIRKKGGSVSNPGHGNGGHGHGHGHGHGNHGNHGKCKVAKCHNKVPKNSHRICTVDEKCAFACDAGFRYDGKKCVAGRPACKASLCKQKIPKNSHHTCKDSQCAFGCNVGFFRKGDKCRPVPVGCSSKADCRGSKPAKSSWVCYKSQCIAKCHNGLRLKDNKCVPNETKCAAEECKEISHGTVDCKNNKCHYTCGPSYKYFSTPSGPQCLNLSKDARNCGAVGNVCPEDYAGLGTPRCTGGQCTLTCPAGTIPQPPASGPAFCF